MTKFAAESDHPARKLACKSPNTSDKSLEIKCQKTNSKCKLGFYSIIKQCAVNVLQVNLLRPIFGFGACSLLSHDKKVPNIAKNRVHQKVTKRTLLALIGLSDISSEH